MSDLEKIGGDLAAMRSTLGQAQTRAGAADSMAEQIASRAGSAGFTGIVEGMSRVRRQIGELRVRLGATTSSLEQGTASVGGAPKQPSPEDTINALAPVQEALKTVSGQNTATAAHVDSVKDLVASVLRGGQPGPLMGALDGIKQTLGQVNQRGAAARQSVEAAISRARQIGGQGN